MLTGFEKWDSPALLGYVKTIRKATAQIPLVTDLGDPLLAHWRFGLGKSYRLHQRCQKPLGLALDHTLDGLQPLLVTGFA